MRWGTYEKKGVGVRVLAWVADDCRCKWLLVEDCDGKSVIESGLCG